MPLRPPRSGVEERLELILEEQRAIRALLQQMLDAPTPKQPTGNEIKVDAGQPASDDLGPALKRASRRKGGVS